MNVIHTGTRATANSTPHAQKAPPELTMYKERPSGEISLEEFEKYALDRLRVLKAIEEAKLRGRNDETIQSDVRALWTKHMSGSSRQEGYRKDVVSHHILRLAYCRTADLRAWLLQHEALLFKLRFRDLLQPAQAEFFTSMELPYTAITDDEAQQLGQQLGAVLLAIGDKASIQANAQGQTDALKQHDKTSKPLRKVFYKVPFQAVPDLVANRRVLLRGGQAYVGEDQVYSLVVGAFRSSLSAALVEAARAWGLFAAAEADRLAPLVDSLPSRSVGNSDARKLPVGEISAGQLPGLVAAGHFPLCMTVMYERLTAEHHLKHWGLQQFSLFLKSIGLPLEQALLFFRQQFSPRTSGEKFGKEYAYNIRYNYGQEGKRQDWNEWSCMKIISQEVGGACSAPCECNGGCPYKTFDANQLRSTLSRLSCNERVIKEVLDKVRGKHYQLACGLAFEGISGAPQETGVNKPSKYYASSIELAKERAAAAAAAAGVGLSPLPQQQAGGGSSGPQNPQLQGGGLPATPIAGRNMRPAQQQEQQQQQRAGTGTPAAATPAPAAAAAAASPPPAAAAITPDAAAAAPPPAAAAATTPHTE